VRREFFRRRDAKERLRALFRDFGFLRRCTDYDAASVDIYLIERARMNTRDRGEAEAIAQTAQAGAMIIVDDLWGRRLAPRNALQSHGTFWLLHQFCGLGLLTAGAAREAFLQLRDAGIRLPWRDVDAFLREIGAGPMVSS
jgi:predicted nucleic acid-binding protein